MSYLTIVFSIKILIQRFRIVYQISNQILEYVLKLFGKFEIVINKLIQNKLS